MVILTSHKSIPKFILVILTSHKSIPKSTVVIRTITSPSQKSTMIILTSHKSIPKSTVVISTITSPSQKSTVVILTSHKSIPQSTLDILTSHQTHPTVKSTNVNVWVLKGRRSNLCCRHIQAWILYWLWCNGYLGQPLWTTACSR
ncbi:hypothetical protein ACOMHN_033351 [Nucella lapillus]